METVADRGGDCVSFANVPVKTATIGGRTKIIRIKSYLTKSCNHGHFPPKK